MAIHIGRREFIVTLASVAAAWPLVARAQQPKAPTIGFRGRRRLDPDPCYTEDLLGLVWSQDLRDRVATAPDCQRSQPILPASDSNRAQSSANGRRQSLAHSQLRE
jgi:hypothetical protein